MVFKEIAPYLIIFNIFLSSIIAIKIERLNLRTIDGVFALLGFCLGMLITFINLIYSNVYLISIGVILSISSLIYLRFRKDILLDIETICTARISLKTINIIYFISIIIILYYYVISPHHRPISFFVIMSINVAMIGLEIISSNLKLKRVVCNLIVKVLITSLLLRITSYYASPFPIGSDPWAHFDIIKSLLNTHTTTTLYSTYPFDYILYYSNYPLMHISTAIITLIGNMNIKDSMFISGAILVLSTIFVYLVIEQLSGDIRLALLSMLLINFADYHISWSIEIAPLTFAVAVYSIILYFLIKKNNTEKMVIYNALLILFMFLIIWTHTLSSFIALYTMISLYFGQILYYIIYYKNLNLKQFNSIQFLRFSSCLFFLIVLSVHWMDPNYTFFQSIVEGLMNSLSKEANLLSRISLSNIADNWVNIFNILGFLIYVFFAVIGGLYYLSKDQVDNIKFSLIFTVFTLFTAFFIFPLFGMRNILPYRWTPFIYIFFIILVGNGMLKLMNIIKYKNIYIFLILCLTCFYMITDSVSDKDSKLYGNTMSQRLITTESELAAFNKLNNSSNKAIAADLLTVEKFRIYFKNYNSVYYQLTRNGEIDWNYLRDDLIIWRNITLTKPVQVMHPEVSGTFRGMPLMLLGDKFKKSLQEKFDCIYDNANVRGYIYFD